MTPAHAIKTGLAKSFQFSGRATRAEFWWFAPIGILLPVLISYASSRLVDPSTPLSLLWPTVLTVIALTPLAAAGSRRLQDSGQHGQDIFFPLGPILGALLCTTLMTSVGAAALTSMITMFVPGMVIGAILFIVLGLFLLILPLIGLFSLGPIIGQLIVPSEPDTNQYGPNPNEVPS